MTAIDRPFFEKLNQVSLDSEPKFSKDFRKNIFSDQVMFDLRSEPKVLSQSQYFQARLSGKSLKLEHEPLCDVDASHQRLPLRSIALPSQMLGSFSASLGVHAFFAALYLFGIKLDIFSSSQPESVVEVTFGVELPGQFESPPVSKKQDAEKPVQEQATKSAEQLPQLPQRIEVKTKSPEVADSEMLAPNQLAKVDKIGPVRDLNKNSAAEKQEKSKFDQDKKAIVAPERDKDAQKIDINTLIERMKKEDRKIADKDKAGQKEIPDKVTNSGMNIPDSPLSDPLNAPVPNMPSALAPSGSLAGKKLAGSALEAYKTAALVHMKRFWNIPGIVEFPPTLLVRAVVVLDLFGKIQSLAIDSSSGNKEFDELVLKQIKQAEPFPDFPANSSRTEKIYMLFRPQTID